MLQITLARFASRPARAMPPRIDPFALWRERRALARLDARLLRDAGISAADARIESGRPLWDAPAHWRR